MMACLSEGKGMDRNMIRYLIKNNFKLMFRNTWSITVMLLGPILVIAVLSCAFSELMKSYEGVNEFTVGYRAENESTVSEYMESVKKAGEESGITFYEYPEGEPEVVMANNELAAFVEFTGDEYVLYQSADYEVEGMTLEYFLNRVMSEMIHASLPMISQSGESGVQLPVQELEFMPAVNAQDYYGIIYIVYFCWCAIICATGVLSNEKKYRIDRKFRVSALSNFQMYLAKLVPVTLTVTAGMGIVTVLTILLYDIHWGNPLLSAVVVFLSILAASALGMMIYSIFDNLVITIIVMFSIVWVMGFFGGSFETYMYSGFPDTAKLLSPIYHENRALVELSCMGHSEYVKSAVIYSLAITALCSAVAVLVSGIRKRGKA